jgi:hypothetical protein
MQKPDPNPNPEFENLKAILAIVKSRVRKEAPIDVQCYFLSENPGDPSLAYIEFVTSLSPGAVNPANTPGIPRTSLVPEKVLPIAAWIVRQISKQHPEWFIE